MKYPAEQGVATPCPTGHYVAYVFPVGKKVCFRWVWVLTFCHVFIYFSSKQNFLVLIKKIKM